MGGYAQKKPRGSPTRADASPSRGGEEDAEDVMEQVEGACGMPMPAEVAAVWAVAQRCRPKAPLEGFAALGVRLVGPFELLAGHMAADIDPHMQWRYAHDPPETMTVMTDGTTNRPSKHWCYHRDDPAALPTMVVAGRQGSYSFSIEGRSLLGVLLGIAKGKKDTKLAGFLSSAMEDLGLPAGETAKQVRDARYKMSLGRPFSNLGIAVPYDKKTEVGYRPLGMEPARLKEIAAAVQNPAHKKKADHDDYAELCTFCDIGNDEGDFGHSLEVGLDLFCLAERGTRVHDDALRLLDVSYMLLGRHLFRRTLAKQMKFRSDSSNPPVCKGLKKEDVQLVTQPSTLEPPA